MEITVDTHVAANIEHVWECWTNPEHIKKWNNASADWHTTFAENDVTEGGEFIFTMAAKDGSVKFDLRGTYQHVSNHEHLIYFLEDGRKVIVAFLSDDTGVQIIEKFEAEEVNSADVQKSGWQAILDNFKRYAES